jgi:hypothetical protein
MAWNNPANWVANTILAAAQLNQQLRDNLKRLRNPAQVSTFNGAAQSLANGALTALALNSERHDRVDAAASTMHDTVTLNSRITPNDPGIYLIEGGVSYAAQAVAAGLRNGYLRINGATLIRANSIPMSAVYNNVQVDVPVPGRVWEFNGTTDYVELLGLQTSGGALNVLGSTGYQADLTVTRIG